MLCCGMNILVTSTTQVDDNLGSWSHRRAQLLQAQPHACFLIAQKQQHTPEARHVSAIQYTC